MRLTITVAILTLLLASVTSQAAEPVLQFTPTTPTTVNLSASEQITIEDRVTNQSRRTFRVGLTPMPGITQLFGPAIECRQDQALGYLQSCLLTLEVDGSKIRESIQGGPIVCNGGSRNQCYQPAAQFAMQVNLVTD